MPDEEDPEEMGWCDLGVSKVRSSRSACKAAGGAWTEEEPTVCVVVTVSTGPDDSGLAFLRGFRDALVRRDDTVAGLWSTYAPKYYKLSGPLVRLMLRDPTVRRMMRMGVVNPAVVALRAMSLDVAGAGDDAVLAEVRRGVRQLTDEAEGLGKREGAADLVNSVLGSLADMASDEKSSTSPDTGR